MKHSLFDLLKEEKPEQKEEVPVGAIHAHLEKGNPVDENDMYYILKVYKNALEETWEKAERYIDYYCFQGVCYDITSE